jgi:hypothetical protein
MNEDNQDEAQQRLFSKDELAVNYELPPEPLTDTGSNPVWTDNKARFIMLYLRYFVYITHHGTYIDGFAGPQAECETDSWAAKQEPVALRALTGRVSPRTCPSAHVPLRI